MNELAIEIRGIVKSYGKKQVLTGLDLAVPKGSVRACWAPTASGKTTLIKCALGLIRPQAGDARLLGEDRLDPIAAAKARIGYVPQVVNLYPWMKVRHLIDYTAAFYPNWNHALVGPTRQASGTFRWTTASGRFRWANSKKWRSCWRWATSRNC